jgi:phenylacetate-CoA ligase
MQSLRDFYEMLDRSQWWSEAKIVAWQRQQLHFLLNHARDSSPYYKFRLNSVFRRDGMIDWDRWHQIPIVRRSDVVEHFEAILSKAPPVQHGPFRDYQSSGSTGHPVTVRTTQWLLDTSRACNWRSDLWAGLDWSKTILATTAEDKGRAIGDVVGPWGPPWLENAQRGRMIYSPYHTHFPERLRFIEEFGASYHATTAPSAERLAEIARAQDVHVHLDKVLVRGGAVSDLLRSDLRRTFGAEVVELYSSKECGAIAHPCPRGHGYHINAETMLFEVVDAEGFPVAPGQAGRAVITPFASTALPLIRYDQGDIVVAGTGCECGRGLPVIASISGRETGFFRHPDGRKLDRELPQECREMIGAGQIQVAQVGRTEFEVRYAPRDWGVPRDEAKFVQRFREIFFQEASVKLVEMREIPLSAAGKFLASVVEWREAKRPS